jgi:DedD protein
MAKQQNEDELNIKRKARRRLIGAVALALAVVVILPMVLDSEPKITGKDIDLRIPAADKVGEFVPGVALSEVVEAATLAESAVIPVIASAVSDVKLAELPVKSTEVKPVEVRKVDAKPTETKPPEVKKVEVKPPETAVVKPVDAKKADAKVAEVKKVETKPIETKAADVKPVKPAEIKPVEDQLMEKTVVTYIVQVGAYANAATATQEAEKLKGWGFKAYTEQISGTTRVRVGPYTVRSKADEVRTALENHGMNPVITAVK